MRYLVVRRSGQPQILGFASCMLTYEDGKEVIYLYEIHLMDQLRGVGLGRYLIELVSGIGRNAGVEKMMLTVFNRNTQAAEWYSRLGFSNDEFQPEAKTLRSGVVKQGDYRILSRSISVGPTSQ